MLGMLVTAAAILVYIQPVRIVFLVFHGRVIAFFAVITRQSDDHAIVFLSHGSFSVSVQHQLSAIGPLLSPKFFQQKANSGEESITEYIYI